MAQEDEQPGIEEICNFTRQDLKRLEKTMRGIEKHPEVTQNEQAYLGQHGEMLAQAKLAVQAIEDARMRCGKVLQYGGDGVSIYDKVDKA